MTTDQDPKVRETRVRRAAERQRRKVVKSRRRDPRAIEYGKFWLVDERTGAVIVGGEDGVALDEIEAALSGKVNR